MKIFQAVQEQMANMGFAPNQQQNNRRPFSPRQIICIVKYCIDLSCCAASIFFEADSTEEYMEALYASTAVGCITIAFISISFNNDNIFYTIELTENEGNFRSNKSSISRALQIKTNQFIEKLSRIIHLVTIRLGIPGMVLPKTILCYFIYYTTDAGIAAFELPFPVYLPFDWKNPIGYFFAIIWQYISMFLLHYFVVWLATLVFGCFLFAHALAKDWKRDLRVLKRMAKTKSSELDISKQLAEFIRSHSNTK